VSNLLILGAGEYGQEVADMALHMGCWHTIAWLDDNPGVKTVLPVPILDSINNLEQYRHQFDTLVVAIGDPRVRLLWLKRGESMGFKIPVLQHPTATVSAYTDIAPGTVILAQAVIKVAVKVGLGNIIGSQAMIGHHCQLADGVYVGAQSVLTGGVQVGARAWIGLGVSVLQQRTIGADAVVGAGAVVLHTVWPKTVVVGVPAVKLRNVEPTLERCVLD